MKRFLHLAVSPVDETYRELVESKLNKATDWLRYLPNCWLVYTAQPASVWYKRLSEIETTNQRNLFVAELNLQNRAGWIKSSAWEWITKKRPS